MEAKSMKTRYLLIVSLFISALAFGSVLYTIALGKVNPPEQPSSKAILVYDADFQATINQYTYITSFDTEDYTFVYIMPKVSGTLSGLTIQVYPFENNLGVQVFPGLAGPPYVDLNTYDTNRPDYGAGRYGYNIYGQTFDLYLYVGGGNFDGHLTISVYLTDQS
jgi:hypothetical protein